MDVSARHLLLTGRPGIGKTTVLQGIVQRIEERKVAGFLTEEIREDDGGRSGFRAVPVDGGEPTTIAHVDFPGPTVSKYGVDVEAIDKLVAEHLEGKGTELYVIDEIGKMECLSERFVTRTRALLDGDTPLVATVASSGGGFIAEAKEHDDAGIVGVTRRNRDELPERMAERLRGD